MGRITYTRSNHLMMIVTPVLRFRLPIRSWPHRDSIPYRSPTHFCDVWVGPAK